MGRPPTSDSESQSVALHRLEAAELCMRLLQLLLQSLFNMGYFGPLVMGILDSSFLILPFGNDLLVVGLVAENHAGAGWVIFSAACGSTLGALLLALVARKLGEKGITRLTGKGRYRKLKNYIESHGGIAIAIGGLAPPPFPFTTVIAGTAALKYPLWRLLMINFAARTARFTLLALLAIEFGSHVLRLAKSAAFESTMCIFIACCVAASAYSVMQLLRRPRTEPG
jgi:membrane protein YqaA with SNARE-associated domain